MTNVKTELSEALAILHNRQMPEAQRCRALQQLAERNLDLQRMARASLGDHWNEITPPERDQFVALFTAFIEEAYLTRIQDYVELNIDVGKARLLRPDYAEVDGTVIQANQEALPIPLSSSGGLTTGSSTTLR